MKLKSITILNTLQLKFYILTLTFLYISIYNNAFCQVTFVKSYYNFIGHSIQPTNDGGFILTGIDDNNANPYNVALMKIDETGNILWAKCFAGDSIQWGEYVEQTSSGGFIMVGRTNSFGAGEYDIYAIKTDSVGDTLWTRTYGGPYDDWSPCIHKARNGGYYIAGHSIISGTTGAVCLIRLNDDGDILWSKIYNTPHFTMAQNAQQTADKGFILAGAFWSNYSQYIYLLKTDSVGNLEWDKYYGPSFSNAGSRGYGVKQTSDGGYIVAGNKGISSPGLCLFNIIKTDSSGNMLWDKVYGDTTANAIDYAYTIEETPDGGIMAAGTTHSFGPLQLYMVKTDNNGNLEWSKTYGGSTGSIGEAFAIMWKGNSYVITGQMGGLGTYPYYIFKTDSNGNAGCLTFSPPTNVYSYSLSGTNANGTSLKGNIVAGMPPTQALNINVLDMTYCISTNTIESSDDNIFEIYPNPVNEILLIDVQQKAIIEIFNIRGQIIKTFFHNGERTSIDTGDLSSGVYIIKAITDNEIVAKKFIKQ